MVLCCWGCATFMAPRRYAPSPTFVTVEALSQSDLGVALVLSGGSARGFAHVGVIRTLEAHGLRPSIVVGSSAGAIVGALYASGMSAAEIEHAARDIDMGILSDWLIPGLGFIYGELGLVRGERLQAFVDSRLRHAVIEGFPLRFAVVATDLGSGSMQVFNAGHAGLAVRASCAVPGLIAPVRIDGRYYGDGQIVSPLPVLAARMLGARKVIAIDVVYPPEDAEPSGPVDMLFQAGIVAANQLKNMEAAGADLLIRPVLPRTTGQLGLEDREKLIEAGAHAAARRIEELRRLFGKR
jgi:NTE family protein